MFAATAMTDRRGEDRPRGGEETGGGVPQPSANTQRVAVAVLFVALGVLVLALTSVLIG